MRELTEVDAVSQDFVNLLQEVSSSLAVGTAKVELGSGIHFLHGMISLASAGSGSSVEALLTVISDDIALSID